MAKIIRGIVGFIAGGVTGFVLTWGGAYLLCELMVWFDAPPANNPGNHTRSEFPMLLAMLLPVLLLLGSLIGAFLGACLAIRKPRTVAQGPLTKQHANTERDLVKFSA